MTTFAEQAQQEQDNQQAFETLLSKMEEASAGVVRDAGTRFETLIKDWLMKEPTYRDLFTKVQTYKEWAQEHPEHTSSQRDIGIDLVATNAQDGLFTAIQCKFYEADAIVPKSGIDSFIAASSRTFFSQRFIVATNEKWSDNVREELSRIHPPVTLITRSFLAESPVDWSAYLQGKELSLQAKRTPRDYQKAAIENVRKGFEEHDRGKLIMACGTGKTFTSMKIAEEMEGVKKGFVCFLVPSLSLLSQTLADWKRQCAYPIHAFAVCSDKSTGKGDLDEIESLTVKAELAYPATTDAKHLAEKVKDALAKDGPGMTVIFSTYQSIDVIHEAQADFGMAEIGLVVCDEAHRTAGGRFVNEEETHFTRIHDNDYIRAKKRLYMTATPKVYGQAAKDQEAAGDVELYSMDDETVFGPTFHTISFTQAVQLGSLVDYKVIVLTVDQSFAGDAFAYDAASNGGLSINDASKVIGCWRALSKRDFAGNVSIGDDVAAMKRAVGFARIIGRGGKETECASMAYAENFQSVIDGYKARLHDEKTQGGTQSIDEAEFEEQFKFKCSTKHIDGSMCATEKDHLLNWLREEPEENECKILFNVRCLSEGVDVPSLDAVLFFAPKRSQVDVVQSVGRVMRIAPGKRRGYIVIPVVVPPGLPADAVLDNNKTFDVVWQVLRALKSIDNEFGVMVDGQLGKINPEKMEVICITNQKDKLAKKSKKTADGKGKKKTKIDKPVKPEDQVPAQMIFEFGYDIELAEAIKARIVKRVGNRREWEDWAEDVGEICRNQIEHIHKVLDNPANTTSRKALDSFSRELKATLNGDLSEDEIIEMLGQHIVTKPIMDALFDKYDFMDMNPISQAMSKMLNALDKDGMKTAQELLKSFYQAVQFRAQNIKTSEERQTVVLELFDKFFKHAFPKLRDKLGIVYTPVQVVDFINQSVADLLQSEFNMSIGDEGVHILDPFTGTGTFITRLMQSGLIPTEKLTYKFENELHAQEIVPLAYYVASMNIEATYHDLVPASKYAPNNVMVWTDTFADHIKEDCFKTTLAENNERLVRLNEKDIRVIIGNPPYSVGQESQNDNNQNEHYEQLDRRLAETYAARTNATNKGKLYDSYIRAYRWASDRIGEKGIIGFVTNAGWLESTSADGMRKCMTEEFNKIYIYHLKGNQRTSGERSRQEGGKIFGEGSRSPVIIVFLIKNPESTDHGKIYFHAVDDYLTREEKLATLTKVRSVTCASLHIIVPDVHGDWLNQRDDSFSTFISVAGKNPSENSIFKRPIAGVCTNRDAWVYNSSIGKIDENINRSVNAFIKASKLFDGATTKEEQQDRIVTARELVKGEISWSRGLLQKLVKQKVIQRFDSKKIRKAVYRPFFKQYLYYDGDGLIEMPSKWLLAMPKDASNNLFICTTGVGAKEFSCLMTDGITDLQLNFNGQCFARWLPGAEVSLSENVLDFGEQIVSQSGFSDRALPHFKVAYPGKLLTEDDLFYYIYGILHSEDYRTRYANNLMKELPRIPRVKNYEQFVAFRDAGKELADLHVNFESVETYKGVNIVKKQGTVSYRVTQMKWGKIPGKKGNDSKDKTKLIYNEDITIENIPIEAQEYVVNKKSALDWIVERACVKTDKDSGIVNDFNDYAAQLGNPAYPLELFLRVITVSLETLKIVKKLPSLEIHELDKY